MKNIKNMMRTKVLACSLLLTPSLGFSVNPGETPSNNNEEIVAEYVSEENSHFSPEQKEEIIQIIKEVIGNHISEEEIQRNIHKFEKKLGNASDNSDPHLASHHYNRKSTWKDDAICSGYAGFGIGVFALLVYLGVHYNLQF